MNEGKPFPSIPRLPEEEKLKGPPREAHESALLAREEGLPLLKLVGDDVTRFQTIPQIERKRQLQRERFRELLFNPDRFEVYFDTLKILEAGWVEKKKDCAEFNRFFEDNFDRYLKETAGFNPEMLRKWLEVSVKSRVYGPTAEKVLNFLYQRADSPKRIVDLLYDFTQAVLESQDKDVFERGLKMLCWDTDIFPPEKERVLNYSTAPFMGDDSLFCKFEELDDAVMYLAIRNLPDEAEHRESVAKKHLEDYDFESIFSERFSEDQGKFKGLLNYYGWKKKIGTKGATQIPPESSRDNVYPWTVLAEKWGRVRVLMSERAVQDNPDKLVYCAFPAESNVRHGGAFRKTDLKPELILKILQSQPTGSNLLIDHKYIIPLFYLSPELSGEQKDVLSEDCSKLRKEIADTKRHLISPRGDRVLIVDPELKELGFRELLFELGNPKTRTTVTAGVGNYKFRFGLNEELGLEESKSRKPLFLDFRQGSFFEHMVLSHLRELQCTERVEVGTASGTASGADKLEREKEFTERRAHLRRLPGGQGYTESQRRFALTEAGIDLIRLNNERGRSKESGQITFVRAVEDVAIGRKEPLISRAPRAMDRYRAVISITK